MPRLDKSTLHAYAMPTEEFEVMGGATVLVRGLTRAEAMRMQEALTKSTADAEVMLLAAGLVDPPMSQDEVKRWLAAWPVDAFDALEAKIMELSKIGTPEVVLEAGFPGGPKPGV